MAHQMCRECHRLISEKALVCPHCGIKRPASSDGPLAHLRPYASALVLGLVLLWLGGLWFGYQVRQLQQPRPGPMVTHCSPNDLACAPTYAVMCQVTWMGDSAQKPPMPQLTPEEQAWCDAQARRDSLAR